MACDYDKTNKKHNPTDKGHTRYTKQEKRKQSTFRNNVAKLYNIKDEKNILKPKRGKRSSTRE